MKTKKMLLAALMLCIGAGTLQAQTFYPGLKKLSVTAKDRLEKNLAAALSDNNAGLVQSALAIVTKIKLDEPAGEYAKIREGIEALSIEGATPVIRYKAYIAEAVFANPSMFAEECSNRYADEDAFFSALAQKMTKTLLSAN